MNTKNLFSIALSVVSAAFFAQTGNVGINTTTPGTTLDVNGAITNRETAISITSNNANIPANISQAQLTGSATAAVSISVPAAPNAGQRLVIFNNTTGGFGAALNGVTIPNGKALEFVYSNAGWRATDGGTVGAAPVNIYTADGALSSNRIVTQGANTLAFTANQPNAFSVAGSTFSVDAANNRVGVGTSAPTEKLEVRGNGKFESNFAQIIASSTGTNPASIDLTRYNGNTNIPAGQLVGYLNFNGYVNNSPLTLGAITVAKDGDPTTVASRMNFYTNGNGSTPKMVLDPFGNIGIGTNAPTKTLDVNGNARFRSLPTQTSLGSSNMLLSDGTGVVSQITGNDFINTLKTPNNIFNAEQTTNIATTLPGNGASNRVRFGTVNINSAGAGTWNFANNSYTVAKAGIYQIVAGVELGNTSSTTSYGLYINAGTKQWVYNGVSQIGNLFTLSGTYVKLLNVGDVIYCETRTGPGGASYTQNTAFMHIIYTAL
ncbi:hypothetical protein [Chryseobacterium sp. JV274]|uniref:hypothetical protein n=1 Tax=Chryseobacterium sp. JV274 TaxID=1932669 RepID=UPI000984D66D|nr:hypothetical protein [Chryseobacterium sp. JV274]